MTPAVVHQPVKELIDAGKITPVIDRMYPLSEVPNAIRYLREGRARGKLVICVRGADASSAHTTA
jgi:NADPH:quinone reductase-like Zn-dependent oxidoreductase